MPGRMPGGMPMGGGPDAAAAGEQAAAAVSGGQPVYTSVTYVSEACLDLAQLVKVPYHCWYASTCCSKRITLAASTPTNTNCRCVPTVHRYCLLPVRCVTAQINGVCCHGLCGAAHLPGASCLAVGACQH
jgi:hypothetical protein